MTGVTAVVSTFAPREELALVLDELARAPVDEVIVVENGPNRELEGRKGMRVLRPGRNIGIEARNMAAREARAEAGVPAFFFPEGACMVRRSAFLEVGGRRHLRLLAERAAGLVHPRPRKT